MSWARQMSKRRIPRYELEGKSGAPLQGVMSRNETEKKDPALGVEQ